MVAGKMTAAQRALVVENMHVADNYVYFNYIANPAIAGFTQEDLRQTGYLALCKAAIHYNGQVQFDTYAQKVLRSSLADYCARMLPSGMDLSMDAQLGADEEDCSLHTFLSDPSAQKAFAEVESRDLLASCKRKYSGITRKGIEALELKMQGFTGPEIAHMYGCKANEITAWISRARQQLRADLGIQSALSYG